MSNTTPAPGAYWWHAIAVGSDVTLTSPTSRLIVGVPLSYQLTIDMPFRDLYAGGGSCNPDAVTHRYRVDGTLAVDRASLTASAVGMFIGGGCPLCHVLVATNAAGTVVSGDIAAIAPGLIAANPEFQPPLDARRLIIGKMLPVPPPGVLLIAPVTIGGATMSADGNSIDASFDGNVQSDAGPDVQFNCTGHYTFRLAPAI